MKEELNLVLTRDDVEDLLMLVQEEIYHLEHNCIKKEIKDYLVNGMVKLQLKLEASLTND